MVLVIDPNRSKSGERDIFHLFFVDRHKAVKILNRRATIAKHIQLWINDVGTILSSVLTRGVRLCGIFSALFQKIENVINSYLKWLFFRTLCGCLELSWTNSFICGGIHAETGHGQHALAPWSWSQCHLCRWIHGYSWCLLLRLSKAFVVHFEIRRRPEHSRRPSFDSHVSTTSCGIKVLLEWPKSCFWWVARLLHFLCASFNLCVPNPVSFLKVVSLLRVLPFSQNRKVMVQKCGRICRYKWLKVFDRLPVDQHDYLCFYVLCFQGRRCVSPDISLRKL